MVWEILMEMRRFYGKAKEDDQGAVALVLDLAKAFERVSLPVVWAWVTHFSFTKKTLRVLRGYFDHQRRVQFGGCAVEPLRTITTILSGGQSGVACFLRIVLQDALSEITKIYLPLKMKVFVDDITALLMVKNKEVAEMAKEGYEEIERRDWKEGKSKMIASCGFLENELRQFSREEGVTLADSVETLGVDLRTRVRFSLINKI